MTDFLNQDNDDIIDVLISCAMINPEEPPQEPPKEPKKTIKYSGYYARYATYKRQYQKDNRDKINEYQKQRYREKTKHTKLLKALELINSTLSKNTLLEKGMPPKK
jgi:hypothetical protein